MAEQFLKRPKIGSASQQMRRETMAQGMRSQAVGQTKPPAGCSDCAAYEIRIERTSAGSDEQRRIAGQRVRTLPCIILNRLANRGDDGDDPCL